ncbi:hypothetical protein [Pleomorphomonas carboxyditropha]|uniref:Uncharacterized protein n=1 Tax=Pleomorphomonas carboxyditropha TaxID=2023338 RepID=A0A2G9WPC5_9HYPH|nr:hypothetical protein [Pleomorphomonas carboxyditropha]PIO96505.1 hypothetical protein CJ014_25070 [Pleomorphomonas carboxyditropha]
MTDRIDDTPFNAATGHDQELSVGAGASIVIAVATSLILAVTLLFASLAPVRAAEIAPAVATLDAKTGAIRPAGDPVPYVTQVPRDMSYAVSSTTTDLSHSLAAIVVMAVLAGWLTVSADLWRALFNRVKSWDRSRS